MGALEEEVAYVCGLPMWQEGKPMVPTEAALPWRRVALPEKAASCHWGREHKQGHNTAPLIKKLWFFINTLEKQKKTIFFPLVTFNRNVRNAFKGGLACSDYGVGIQFANIQS